MKTILVAEDEPGIRRLIQVNLERAGYHVVTVENGKLAWERLQQGGIDLLITGGEMPEMSGFELMGQILLSCEPLCSLPTVLIAIGATNPPLVQYRAFPTFAFEKPFLPAELVRIVGRILELG